MKLVVYNERQLDTAIRDMYSEFNEYNSLQLEYQKPFKAKTRRQLGFFFGALVDSVIDYFKAKGVIWDKKNVTQNFYEAASYRDDRLCYTCRHFSGQEYTVPKTLSEMSVEEASIFIDICIDLIDHAKCFHGLILHPSIRYTWVRHITEDDIANLRFSQFPRRDPEYLQYQRQQACLCCGRQNCSEPHHLKEAGYTGTGYKADDWMTIPLCHDCHIAGYHAEGKETFEKNLAWITSHLSLVDFCRINYNKWKNKI